MVSGYRWASAPVRDQENRDTEFHLRENTGIVVAYDVNEAIAPDSSESQGTRHRQRIIGGLEPSGQHMATCSWGGSATAACS